MPDDATAGRGDGPRAGDAWRRALRNDLAWLLAAKLAALTLLWALFFRS